MDDRVVAVAETTVSGGQRMRVDCRAPKEGVFFCIHEKLDVFPRVLKTGKCALTAMVRPGVDTVHVAVGEELGFVVPYAKPSGSEVPGNEGKKPKRQG